MEATCEAQLRLLETTDLHMQLTGYDYVLDNHQSFGGLERLSGSIAALRSDGIETILCDNGDFLEGSPLAERAIECPDMADHPMVQAMNALNYDAISLGNHEFDYGTGKLREVIRALDASVLCANVRVSQREHLTSPWTIVTRDLLCSDGVRRPIKVGLIGFVTPMQVHWGHLHEEEYLATDDILAAAMTHLPALRRAGADIAVALAHTGVGPITHQYGMENAAYPLASLRGIDALLLGHTHDQFPKDHFRRFEGIDVENGLILGTPSVMAGHCGIALGQIDLTLTFKDDEWKVAGQKVRVISAAESNAPPDPAVSSVLNAALAPLHDETVHQLSKPYGQTKQDITTYFSAIGYDPTLRLVAQSKMDAVSEGLKGTPYEGLPLLGAAAPFHAGGRLGAKNYIHIKPGNVTAKHVAAMSPFDNPICGVLRRGWQLREWLEEISLQFNVIPKSGGLYPLINDAFPQYHFDTLLGLEYAYDISAPFFRPDRGEEGSQSGRVPVMRYGGTDVLDDDLFVVATSRYRALGGGCIGNVTGEDIIFETKRNARAFIKDRLAADHEWHDEPNWTFMNVPETSVLLESSPDAKDFIPNKKIKTTNQFIEGFRSYELAL